VTKHGLDRAFMLLGAQFVNENGELVDHNHETDPSWAEFWQHQRGPKRDVTIRGARHLSFSDLQVILPQLTAPLGMPPDHWVPGIGTIDPAESIRKQVSAMTGFFDRFLR
jgi:hypothetical protein